MSETKQKQKIAFTTIVSETKEIPKPTVNIKPDGWLSWGETNKFPNYLYDLYLHSSQFNSIVATMKDYLLGDEVINHTNMATINRKGQTFEDLLDDIAFDYILYNGFAFQVIRNHNGDIAELNYIDFRTVRINEDEDKVYVNSGWKRDVAKRGIQTKVYERFIKGTKQPNSIYWYKGKNSKDEYPTPTYIGALTSLEISTQIPTYHLSNICNNFTPSAIVNFNNGDNLPDDVKDEIEEGIKDKFTGTSNAGKIMLSFNPDTEHATTIERLQDDGLDNKYQNLSQSVTADIYSAFRINAVLVGLNKDTGFSKTEFSEAFTLYNRTVIKPMQQNLIDSLETVFGQKCIEIKPFTINWSENEEDKDGAIGTNADTVE